MIVIFHTLRFALSLIDYAQKCELKGPPENMNMVGKSGLDTPF